MSAEVAKDRLASPSRHVMTLGQFALQSAKQP
jgi:hypothetical protein